MGHTIGTPTKEDQEKWRTIKNMNKRELRKLSHETNATIWVGKDGVEKVIEELKGQLNI